MPSVQVQVHGPLPTTLLGVPAAQRSEEAGVVAKEAPCALPQTPFCRALPSHETEAPPFGLLHVHIHGPVPEIAPATPSLQRPFLGFSFWPLSVAGPQTASVRAMALHVAAWPP